MDFASLLNMFQQGGSAASGASGFPQGLNPSFGGFSSLMNNNSPLTLDSSVLGPDRGKWKSQVATPGFNPLEGTPTPPGFQP